MIRVAVVVNLIAYSIIASQPLAYAFFLGKAQRALSAPAYIELRQHINPVLGRRVPMVYSATIVALLLLLALALQSEHWGVLATATGALFCLVVDIVLMMRENVPINDILDGWSAADYPEDWEDYRTKWFDGFGYRQIALLVGFVSLLIGAVLV